MHAKVAASFEMQLPSEPEDIKVRFLEWCAIKGHVVTHDAVVGQFFKAIITTNIPMRQDLLKRSFKRFYANAIDVIVRRSAVAPAAAQEAALVVGPGAPVVAPAAAQEAALVVGPVAPVVAPAAAQEAALAVAPAQQNVTMDDLARMMGELQAQMKKLQEKPASIRVNNNNNIHLHNFGEESLAHLLAPNAYLQQRLTGVTNMIMDTYFHPDHPNNHTVRNRSMKHHMVEIRKGSNWVVKPFDDVANSLISNSIGYVIKDYVPLADDNIDALVEDLLRKKHHPNLRNNVKALMMVPAKKEPQPQAEEPPIAA